MTACIRKYDFTARWGGDEFVIAILTPDQAKVSDIVERIKDNLLAIEISDQQQFKPSVSIGVATYPIDGRTLNDLIGVADNRMYKQKGEYKAQYINSNQASDEILTIMWENSLNHLRS